jgi:hypothetical protein
LVFSKHDPDYASQAFVGDYRLVRAQSAGPGVVTASETVTPLVVPHPTLAVAAPTANDRPWNVEAIIKRPFVIATTTWDSTAVTGTVIETIALPQAFEAQPILNNIYNTFTISRFSITLTFTMTGTKFHQGALMCAWRPMTGPNGYETPSVQTMYLTPHCFLRADVPNTISLDLPFAYDSSYYPYYMDPTVEPFGYLNIMVFSQLAFATGASPVLTMSITAAINDIEFHIPRTPFTVFVPTLVSASEVSKKKTYLEDKMAKIRVVRPQSTDQKATAGGITEVPTVVGRPLGKTPEGGCDRVNSIRDFCKRLVPLAQGSVLPPNLANPDNSLFSNPQCFDASLVYNPTFGNSPLSYFANWYRLARGSVRYEIDLSITPNKNDGAAYAHNFQMYCFFLPKYFPKVPNLGYQSIYQADPADFNKMFPVVNLDPTLGYPYADTWLDVAHFLPKSTTANYTFDSATQSATGVNSTNWSPFVSFAPLVASADGFTCSLSLEVPFVHNRHAYRVPNYYVGGSFYDNVWYADGPVSSSGAPVHTPSPYARATPISDAHSAGTIFFGLYRSSSLITSTLMPTFSYQVSGSAGDDFRLGVLADLPQQYLTGSNFFDANLYPGFGLDMFDSVTFAKSVRTTKGIDRLADVSKQDEQIVKGRSTHGSSVAAPVIEQVKDKEIYSLPMSTYGSDVAPPPVEQIERDSNGQTWDEVLSSEDAAGKPPDQNVVGEKPPDQIRFVRPQGNVNASRVITQYYGAVSGSNPINVTGDKFDAKADVSIPADAMATAMDKPSFLVQMPGNKIYQYNYRSGSTGIFFGERAALCTSDLDESDPKDFGTDKDEMSFEYLRSIPGVVAAFPWTTSSAANSILAEVPISPFILDGGTDGFLEPTPGNSYRLNMLATTCLPFLMWRGQLRWRVRFFASGFHTGKLFIAVNYHPYRTGAPATADSSTLLEFAPTTAADAMSQYGMYIDLSPENSDVTFATEYVSHEQFTFVNHWRANQRNNIGTISFIVIQPLVAVPGTQPSIDIVLEQWAGDDFSTHTLAPAAAAWTDRPPTLVP